MKLIDNLWVFTLICAVWIGISALITIFTPEPYTFIPPLVMAIPLGVFMRWWVLRKIKQL